MEEDKVCDIFVQRVFKDENLDDFDWGVSVVRFEGDELVESATYALFRRWSLAKDYAKSLAEFFKSRGYEVHLKGEVG